MTKPQELILLGKIIRKHREALGVAQDKFAYLNGLNRTYFGQIERGDANMTFEILLRIAKGLNMTIGELFADFDTEFEKYVMQTREN